MQLCQLELVIKVAFHDKLKITPDNYFVKVFRMIDGFDSSKCISGQINGPAHQR